VLSALSAVPNVIGLTVAVVGQGPIGQLFNACLSGAGAARVIGIDVREARVARSCEFGATDVVVVSRDDEGAGAFERVREITGGTMADLVVEAVGHAEQQFNLATSLARNKGRVLYFGIPPDRLDGIAFEPVIRKSLTIHTSVPGDLRPFVTIAMRAIRQGRIDPLRLITHRLPFGDLQTAFETYRNRRDGALKVVLNF
jgi:threonine dehydrogenase-like Zn-dependent dehydrogenase